MRRRPFRHADMRMRREDMPIASHWAQPARSFGHESSQIQYLVGFNGSNSSRPGPRQVEGLAALDRNGSAGPHRHGRDEKEHPMSTLKAPRAPLAQVAPGEKAAEGIARIIGQFYGEAPIPVRVRLLNLLLWPLGAYSILTVANGVFGKIWLRHGWGEFRVRGEDVQDVHTGHVFALVEQLQQLRTRRTDELLRTLGALASGSRSFPAESLMTLLEPGAKFSCGGTNAARDVATKREPVLSAGARLQGWASGASVSRERSTPFINHKSPCFPNRDELDPPLSPFTPGRPAVVNAKEYGSHEYNTHI
jgi:hypothetical protein